MKTIRYKSAQLLKSEIIKRNTSFVTDYIECLQLIRPKAGN